VFFVPSNADVTHERAAENAMDGDPASSPLRSGHRAMNAGSREYPARPLVGIGVVLLRRGETGWQVLLIRRGREPARGSWSLPGGAQRVGETAETAARRELMEETGLQAGALRLAAHVDSIHHDAEGRVRYHYTILDFAGLWQGGEPAAGGDAQAARWAAAEEFDGLALWKDARRVIAAAIVTVEQNA
jgi:ADP-ribose pyrophosphatase YjhB (NUDIX family)